MKSFIILAILIAVGHTWDLCGRGSLSSAVHAASNCTDVYDGRFYFHDYFVLIYLSYVSSCN